MSKLSETLCPKCQAPPGTECIDKKKVAGVPFIHWERIYVAADPSARDALTWEQ